MEIKESALPGCFEISPFKHTDERGLFVKTFQREFFTRHGLVTEYAEEYYSVSRQGVLRGLHFQLPPWEHTKVVYCTAGEVMDVVVDLRVGSPAYGRYASFTLSAQEANMVYIPPGFGHGFCVLSQSATVLYKVTSAHSPQHDAGIRWDSLSIPWPVSDPIISQRDSNLPPLCDFRSPFLFDKDKLH